ncbi:MAG TPA: sugar ABC transporter permease, partial [Propionibacteriaceae bacterium]
LPPPAPTKDGVMTVNTAAPSADIAQAPVRRLRGGISGGWRGASANQLFLVPIAAVFLVLFIIPLGQTFYWSLTDFTGYSADVTFVGLDNYRVILRDPSMLAGLAFTLLFAVGTTALITVIALPLAVVLDKRFFGRNFVRSMFFFPAIPSMAVLGLVWGYILSPLGSGVLNAVLETLFHAGPFPWLSDDTLAKISVIAVGVWGGAGSSTWRTSSRFRASTTRPPPSTAPRGASSSCTSRCRCSGPPL